MSPPDVMVDEKINDGLKYVNKNTIIIARMISSIIVCFFTILMCAGLI